MKHDREERNHMVPTKYYSVQHSCILAAIQELSFTHQQPSDVKRVQDPTLYELSGDFGVALSRGTFFASMSGN